METQINTILKIAHYSYLLQSQDMDTHRKMSHLTSEDRITIDWCDEQPLTEPVQGVLMAPPHMCAAVPQAS